MSEGDAAATGRDGGGLVAWVVGHGAALRLFFLALLTLYVVGAMAGAALEYFSLALGYRALGLIVVGLYVGAAVWALGGARREA